MKIDMMVEDEAVKVPDYDPECLGLVESMIGRKAAEDARRAIEDARDPRGDGAVLMRAAFSRGVMWACLAVRRKSIQTELARAAAFGHEDIPDEQREGVREIYKGAEYRYYPEDIVEKEDGISYVSGLDEAGKVVVLKLENGAVSGVTWKQ